MNTYWVCNLVEVFLRGTKFIRLENKYMGEWIINLFSNVLTLQKYLHFFHCLEKACYPVNWLFKKRMKNFVNDFRLQIYNLQQAIILTELSNQ